MQIVAPRQCTQGKKIVVNSRINSHAMYKYEDITMRI